ncbi:MAG TPA: hypothetical protein VE175_03310, partial [Woeseiaceae bacterium]|nr:hypothetical protein [Woeseiaceae bacterium]
SAPSAGAWTLDGGVLFVPVEPPVAKGAAFATSDDTETFAGLVTFVTLTEQGVKVDEDGDVCYRQMAGTSIFCGSQARDFSVTLGCEYCALGEGVNIDASSNPLEPKRTFKKCKKYDASPPTR